jgi:hypothetical protein
MFMNITITGFILIEQENKIVNVPALEQPTFSVLILYSSMLDAYAQALGKAWINASYSANPEEQEIIVLYEHTAKE